MSAHPFLSATERALAAPVPGYVQSARAACDCMTDEQRVAFATELVLQVTDTRCRLQLRRLISAADLTANDLRNVAFARGEIV